MARKKAKKEEAEKPDKDVKVQAKSKKEKKSSKTKTKKTSSKSEGKGRLVVSQTEKDEIDAVIDTFWVFIDKVKKAPKHLMIIGIFLTLIGATFSGWAQELAGHEKNGLWYAYTEKDEDLSLDPNGMFPNYSPGDEIRIEGAITEIEYFGLLDDCSYTNSSNLELCEKYPVIHKDFGIVETKSYSMLEPHTVDSVSYTHLTLPTICSV